MARACCEMLQRGNVWVASLWHVLQYMDIKNLKQNTFHSNSNQQRLNHIRKKTEFVGEAP